MEYKVFLGIMLLFFLLWLGMHLKDRRRLLNGLWFIIAMASLSILLMTLSILKDFQYLQIFLGLGLVGLLIIVSIAYLGFVISLFLTAKTVIKREGFSLTNILGLFFGLGIVLSSLASTMIDSLGDYKILKALIVFGNSYFIYFALGFFIYLSSAIVYNFYIEKKNKDFLIVLGAGLNGEEVTPLLASRIDKAIEFYYKQVEKKNKRPMIIMSGGQGPDEIISEAEAMKNYAIRQGIPEEVIICEDRSTSTEENLIFSSRIIEKYKKSEARVLFFTNNYHVFRAALLARKLGKDYNGIGSKTKFYYAIPAFIREYVAVLYMNFKLHFKLSSIFALINFILAFSRF